MSKGLFANWRFRTAYPSFEPGQELEVYLTGFDEASGKGEARIGDTILEVEGVGGGQVDSLVVIRVESFDKPSHRGAARAAD
ncbi:MAG: hypothetical protein GVY32_12240 [Gammaproteobacteria bacterium]|jgi:hypothetical protein|nr:hypothetical protein [Gammaproteobacteria bacterium]